MLKASPEVVLAFLAMAVVMPVRLTLCMVFVRRLAKHGYELELTWTSISLTRVLAADDRVRRIDSS